MSLGSIGYVKGDGNEFGRHQDYKFLYLSLKKPLTIGTCFHCSVFHCFLCSFTNNISFQFRSQDRKLLVEKVGNREVFVQVDGNAFMIQADRSIMEIYLYVTRTHRGAFPFSGKLVR